MKTAKDSGFSASHEEDKSLPILIAPKHDALYMGAYITIQDQTWRIIEADIYTLPAVGFYTLERSMNYIPPVVQDTPYLLYVGQTITLDTYGGKCDIIGAAKVVQRNFESVVIEIAEVGDGTLIITTYDDEDNATDHEYNIKEYI